MTMKITAITLHFSRNFKCDQHNCPLFASESICRLTCSRQPLQHGSNVRVNLAHHNLLHDSCLFVVHLDYIGYIPVTAVRGQGVPREGSTREFREEGSAFVGAQVLDHLFDGLRGTRGTHADLVVCRVYRVIAGWDSIFAPSGLQFHDERLLCQCTDIVGGHVFPIDCQIGNDASFARFRASGDFLFRGVGHVMYSVD
jgi:hypothetical protein